MAAKAFGGMYEKSSSALGVVAWPDSALGSASPAVASVRSGRSAGTWAVVIDGQTAI
jgi:hypothetical protein